MPSTIYHLLWEGVDLIFPPHCAGCETLGYRWCPNCASQVKRIAPPFCEKCGIPHSQRLNPKDHCANFLESIHFIRSCSIYEPPISNAIKKLKYQRDIGIAEILAFYLVELYNTLNCDVDFIIPVPLSKKRFQERGYNQSSLIAKPFSLAIGRPMKTQALFRKKETKSQVGLSREERSENVAGAFFAEKSQVIGKSIILIDDVTTTGSTLEACAKELIKEGAKTIVGLTIARAVTTKSGFNDFVSNQETTKI
jgi:ComF family protein